MLRPPAVAAAAALPCPLALVSELHGPTLNPHASGIAHHYMSCHAHEVKTVRLGVAMPAPDN
eukprot:5743615-Amphidinium_carterae.1